MTHKNVSTKNYIFTLNELAVWDGTVKNIQKLEKSQVIISHTSAEQNDFIKPIK